VDNRAAVLHLAPASYVSNYVNLSELVDKSRDFRYNVEDQMVTDRRFEQADFPLLAESLARDPFHTTTQPEFFTQPGTTAKVYEIDGKPVMFVRGAPALRLDIQFVDNNDAERNRQVMLDQFDAFAERAKANGFTEIIFCTESPILKAFCKRRFKFREVNGELRKYL
jgi:hypothetical protein